MSDKSSPPNRYEKINRILDHLDFDSLLRQSVVLCDLELDGDGCSLFLIDKDQKSIILKESTVLTRYLDQHGTLPNVEDHDMAKHIKLLLAKNNITPEDLCETLDWKQALSYSEEVLRAIYRFGLTRWSMLFKCQMMIREIERDIRWSQFDPSIIRDKTEIRLPPDYVGTNEASPMSHCELSRKEIAAVAIVRIPGVNENVLPKGILRQAWRKNKTMKSPCVEGNLEFMQWLAQSIAERMEFAVSLTDLLELGSKIEVRDFGETVVQMLRRVLKAKGCSIFLDTATPATSEGAKPIRTLDCIATTGLCDPTCYVGPEKDRYKLVDANVAKYKVDLEQTESRSLTGWVIRNGQLAAVKNVYEPVNLPGLKRKPGTGKLSETDSNGFKIQSGSILLSPLFRQDGREVAGVIRVLRTKDKYFEIHEQLLFIDISRRLSKVLASVEFREASERLFAMYNDPVRMLRHVPREVCRLLGVVGCSVYRKLSDNRLRIAATAGAFEGREKELRQYDLSAPNEKGWTAWVALTGLPLLLNSTEDANQYKHAKHGSPNHSDFTKKCEVGEPAYRFLAAPIFSAPQARGSEVAGVIRVPRKEADPAFTNDQLSILVAFAARLSVALDLARRSEQLWQVAQQAVPDLADLPPNKASDRVLSTAVDLLLEEVEFEFAAIYVLDPATKKIKIKFSKSLHEETDPKVWSDEALDPESENIHAQVMRTRKHQEVEQECKHSDEESHGTLQNCPRIRLICPIIVGEEVLGTIEAGYGFRNGRVRISDRQRSMVHLLAGSCARSLVNSLSFRQLNNIRTGLVEVGETMTQAYSTLEQKLKVIAKAAAAVTDASNVIIFEYVDTGIDSGLGKGQFQESACGGTCEPGMWQPYDLKSDAVPYRVIRGCKPIFAKLAENSHVLFHQKDEPNFIQREGIKSVAALPLTVSTDCVGCIFFNFNHLKDFGYQQQLEIKMMAEYAAIAIHQVRLMEKTARLVNEKSALLRYAQHSLNQPLNAILGFLSNLSEGVYNQELSMPFSAIAQYKQSQFGRRAKNQSLLCSYMVNMLDTFLKIDLIQDQKDLFKIEFKENQNLSDICNRAADVAVALRTSRLPISRNIADDIVGYFDPNAIQTALINVLVNAIKYGDSIGERKSKDAIQLHLATEDKKSEHWAIINVDDSGPGIRIEDRERIFRPLERVGRNGRGLGVGLYLTNEYIKRHSGSIDVSESPAGGARFSIFFPLRQKGEE